MHVMRTCRARSNFLPSTRRGLSTITWTKDVFRTMENSKGCITRIFRWSFPLIINFFSGLSLAYFFASFNWSGMRNALGTQGKPGIVVWKNRHFWNSIKMLLGSLPVNAASPKRDLAQPASNDEKLKTQNLNCSTLGQSSSLSSFVSLSDLNGFF